MSAAPGDPVLPGWQAELRLRFNGDAPQASTRTRLVERQHKGPLIVQRPFYPEGDPCHVYLVHPPGGVVGGDELRIDVQVDAGAHALITTPAATKFYRCDGRISSQTQELRAAGATLEWLPQENIFYRGADARTATRVHIDADSRFIGWEINCLGLPARGESFDAGALRLDLELWRSLPALEPAPIKPDPFCRDKGAAPIFLDRVRLTGESPSRTARWGLAGQEAIGTLLATPATREAVESVRELIADAPYAAVSLVDGVLVLRALAPQAEAVRNLFISAWQSLRPRILGRGAVLPRIWAT
ncbi:MAG TPA: urease accessory protein UreD [Steroidobacteraceae bacterium]|nr:urease accessory protein UreD [Steroidobacteraceae bacterium]